MKFIEKVKKEEEKKVKRAELMAFKKKIGSVLKGIENNYITKPDPPKLLKKYFSRDNGAWVPLMLTDKIKKDKEERGDDYPAKVNYLLLKNAIKRKWNKEKARLMTSEGPNTETEAVVLFLI